MRPSSRLVSLYALEKTTGVHRDTLESLASWEGIIILRRGRSRGGGVRCLKAEDARRLEFLATWWSNRPRPYARRRVN